MKGWLPWAAEFHQGSIHFTYELSLWPEDSTQHSHLVNGSMSGWMDR